MSDTKATLTLGSIEVDYNAEHIRAIDTWQSGGGIMLDLIYLKDGTVLIISDELIGLYPNIEAFDTYEDDRIQYMDRLRYMNSSVKGA
jgi:hypothetical protein